MTQELKAEREANSALFARVEELEQQTFDEWTEDQDQIDSLRAEHNDAVTILQSELVEIREQNLTLRAEIQTASFSTTERKSLLIVAIAAAVDGFGYDPNSKRNPATTEIANATIQLGFKMTDETVLKFLKNATSLKGFVAPDMPQRKPNSVRAKPKSV